MLLSHLSPLTIAEVNLEDEDEEEEEEGSDEVTVCSSPQCHALISELQKKLDVTLKTKGETVVELETVRKQLMEAQEALLKEKHDNMILITETVHQKKLLGKFNRVSLFAVEEFETLQDSLNLERDMRTEAENFARAMLVEQKKLKRQSQILMQSSAPCQALQEAFRQITELTHSLETQKMEHQEQMKQMEATMRSCEDQAELTALRLKLELLEEERKEHGNQCLKTNMEVKDLQALVSELKDQLQAARNPRLAPPPPPLAPPPPPPPPPAMATITNPLSSLLALLRKKRVVNGDLQLLDRDPPKTTAHVDVRQQAVEEMMLRIKKGVQLRPVRQTPPTAREQMEKLSCNSAIQELRGITENFSRTTPQPKVEPRPANHDDELQKILLRRRDAVESHHSMFVSTLPSFLCA
uniref:Shootin-1 n=1 Tax=Gouania willdenowi TaxID=441366 RepID=A0A8C5EFK6_GOUWI